jgi:hypothetical protein
VEVARNIEMTMRYLLPMQGKQAQGQINKAFSVTLRSATSGERSQ